MHKDQRHRHLGGCIYIMRNSCARRILFRSVFFLFYIVCCFRSMIALKLHKVLCADSLWLYAYHTKRQNVLLILFQLIAVYVFVIYRAIRNDFLSFRYTFAGQCGWTGANGTRRVWMVARAYAHNCARFYFVAGSFRVASIHRLR